MAHVDFMAAVAGLPSTHVFDLESEAKLDARRQVALPFARKLTRTPEAVGPADIQLLRAQFDDKQIVQLVFAVCHFNTMNRLADAFGVPLEPTNVFAAPPKRPDAVKPEPAATAGAAPERSPPGDDADPKP
jgi:hypothetical protein